MSQSLHLNMMTAAYVEEDEELLDGNRDYSVSPHLKRRAVVHLFCRDANGKRYVIKDHRGTFKPYLYVPSRSDNKEGLHDFLGRYVKRLEVDVPRSVPGTREKFKFTDEADILFEKRFLIDKKIRCGLRVDITPGQPSMITSAPDLDIQPRKWYYDFEMAATGDINPRNAEFPIVLASAFDSYTDNLYAFLHRPPLIKVKELKEVFDRIRKSWQTRGFKVMLWDCPNEFQTVNQFIQQIKVVDPDHLIAHNGDRFDFPYLFYRCQKKKWRIMRNMSPLGRCHMQGNYPRIDGREHIDFCGDKAKHDGMYTNFTVQDTDIDSLRLEELAEFELGYKYRFGKIGHKTHELWHSEDPRDIFKLLYYGLEDAWVMPTIDRKKGMSSRYETIRRIFGCTTRDALSNSIFIDIGCLRLSDKPLPTKIRVPYDDKIKKKAQIEGALVIRPKAGIHGEMPDE